MSWLAKFFGEATAAGASTALNGVGDAAIKVREAITGEMPTEKKAEIEIRFAELAQAIAQAQGQIVIAEAQGQSWLQRNWRPLLMLTIIIIVANNYILYPYLSMFTDKAQVLNLPSELWSLMQIGIGGYIVGRTVEKIKGAE